MRLTINIGYSMNINNFLKGIIIGIAKIIPGLSGAVLMISFNLYDKALEAITHFFEKPKKNFVFLFTLGLGIVIGIVLFSKVISFLMMRYYLYTTALFLGLIMGGIPVIGKRVSLKKNIALIMISFLIVTGLSCMGGNEDYVLKNTYVDFLVFFGAGLLEAVGTVLPGISSTALLMLMGVYNHYLTILSGALNIGYLLDTLGFILPFSLGMVIGIIGISILVNYLFNHHKEQTFACILGVSISSIISLGSTLIPYIKGATSILISLIMLGIGYLVTNRLD